MYFHKLKGSQTELNEIIINRNKLITFLASHQQTFTYASTSFGYLLKRENINT